MLDVCPVRRYPAPRYPTRLMALADAELLLRHAPPSWRASRTIAGAAALLLAASGCSQGSPPRRTQQTCSAPTSGVAARAAPRVASLVAPIFGHGEGRGSTGCIVVNPPVFFSEEEALQVIREQLGRAGVQLGGPAKLDGVAFRRPEGEPQQALIADGVDRRRKIAVEFVSLRDADQLVDEDEGPYSYSSVRGYALKEVAQGVARRVRSQGPRGMRVGVLYDPVEHAGRGSWKDWERNRARAADRARRQLRAQVVDFVNWLIGQGAI